MSKARIEAIQQTPMFGAINVETISFLLERANCVERSAGADFFREGDEGSSAFLLEVGEVTVSKSWQGVEQPLRKLGEGDCFGEVALLDLGLRSASVRAETDARALEFGAPALLALRLRDVEQFALIYMNLGRELSRRLRKADERLFRARFERLVVGDDDDCGAHSV